MTTLILELLSALIEHTQAKFKCQRHGHSAFGISRSAASQAPRLHLKSVLIVHMHFLNTYQPGKAIATDIAIAINVVSSKSFKFVSLVLSW